LLLSLVKAIAVAYALACAAAWLFQSKLIWFPGGAPRITPAELGLRHLDLALVTRDGVKLDAWLIEAPSPRGVVLFCHGNAGSIEQRLDHARELVGMGVSVLLFDYRGFGRSDGAPSEEGTFLDAEAAWEAATHELGFAPEQVVAWGESLGGAVAVELALRRTVGALVTESAFTSLADVAAAHYRWLPVRWLLSVRYDVVGKAARLRVPWLLLHSGADEIVPFAHAERLLAAARAARPAPDSVELVRTRAGHNDGGFLREPAAAAALAAFLERVVPRRP